MDLDRKETISRVVTCLRQHADEMLADLFDHLKQDVETFKRSVGQVSQFSFERINEEISRIMEYDDIRILLEKVNVNAMDFMSRYFIELSNHHAVSSGNYVLSKEVMSKQKVIEEVVKATMRLTEKNKDETIEEDVQPREEKIEEVVVGLNKQPEQPEQYEQYEEYEPNIKDEPSVVVEDIELPVRQYSSPLRAGEDNLMPSMPKLVRLQTIRPSSPTPIENSVGNIHSSTDLVNFGLQTSQDQIVEPPQSQGLRIEPRDSVSNIDRNNNHDHPDDDIDDENVVVPQTVPLPLVQTQTEPKLQQVQQPSVQQDQPVQPAVQQDQPVQPAVQQDQPVQPAVQPSIQQEQHLSNPQPDAQQIQDVEVANIEPHQETKETLPEISSYEQSVQEIHTLPLYDSDNEDTSQILTSTWSRYSYGYQ